MEQLPFEIWHLIFDYLDPFDIFNAFLSLNRSIDQIVYLYNRLKLDFRLMSKWKFRFICQRLQGCQVQSLLLSNDENSPGQVDFFFSLFTFYQFFHLQSIELKEISDANFLVLIFSHLENHPYLQSISIQTASMSMNKRNSRQLMDIFISLPKLRSLKYDQSSSLIDLRRPLMHLRHLTIYSCRWNDLRMILPLAPNLISLEAKVTYHLNDRLEAPPKIVPLKSLTVQSRQWTTFVDLQNFLRRCPSLHCLIIETTGDAALLDGNEWKRLIESDLPELERIELNLSPEENPLNGKDVLLPFENSFWIEGKRAQFVSFISSTSDTCVQLFTVPYFNPPETSFPPSEGFYYYSMHSYSVEQHCTALRIWHYHSIDRISFIFANIGVLSLDTSLIQIEQINAILRLSSVNHLKLSKSVDGKSLFDLLHHGSTIDQLTLHRQTLVQFDDLTSNASISFPQIRILRLNDSTPMVPFARLARIFSQLERFYLSIKEREEIVEVLRNFSPLKNAHFRWLHRDQSSAVVSHQWFEDQGIPLDEYAILNNYQCDLWIDSIDH